MNQNLKELVVHGSAEFPFALYHIRALRHSVNVSLHWHDEVEIIYVTQGTLHLTIDKTSYIANAGDIFIVNSQEIHEMSVLEPPTVYYTILFPVTSLIFQFSDNSNKQFLLPLAESRMQFQTFPASSATQEIYKNKLEEIISLYQDKKPAYQLGIKSHLLVFLYMLYSNNDIVESKKDLTYNKLHREILLYINENYSDSIALAEIAATFHMVPKYFSRYFKNTFHTTLSEYILQLRLEKAISLLSDSTISVTEAAFQSGFSSCSYFNKCFKNTFGTTPKKYLQNIKSYHTTH